CAVLRGLTSSHGGMVAAATTSLPERSAAGRNYDYRYAWIRDQSYAGQAAAVAGLWEVLDAAVGFIAARILRDGPDLRPAYTVDGGPLPEERHLRHIIGYPGGGDRAGNRVRDQFQLDVFGEALLLFAAAARVGRLGSNHWRAVEVAVEAIEQRREDRGAGPWPRMRTRPGPRGGVPGRQRSSRTPRATPGTPPGGGSEPRPIRGWTPRCSCRRSGAASPPMTRAAGPPWRRCAPSWHRT